MRLALVTVSTLAVIMWFCAGEDAWCQCWQQCHWCKQWCWCWKWHCDAETVQCCQWCDDGAVILVMTPVMLMMVPALMMLTTVMPWWLWWWCDATDDDDYNRANDDSAASMTTWHQQLQWWWHCQWQCHDTSSNVKQKWLSFDTCFSQFGFYDLFGQLAWYFHHFQDHNISIMALLPAWASWCHYQH